MKKLLIISFLAVLFASLPVNSSAQELKIAKTPKANTKAPKKSKAPNQAKAQKKTKSFKKTKASIGNRTLVIGGGIAGVHMAYLLQKLGQQVDIWEMTDRVAGKAAVLFKDPETGMTLDTGGNLLPTIAYREMYNLAEELDMKNYDHFKRCSFSFTDPNVSCFFVMGFKKCNLDNFDDATKAEFSAPILSSKWILGRGLMLMQDAGYFSTFMQNSGEDWTSPTFPTEILPQLFVKTLLGEIQTFSQFMNQYTDHAFDDYLNLDNNLNKYGFPLKKEGMADALNQTILEFIQKHDLFFFRPLVEYAMAMQGYGELNDTPLLYLGMWFNPQFIHYFSLTFLQLRDPVEFDGWLYLLKGGITSLCDAMISQGYLNINFNREVVKVQHVGKIGRQFFKVHYKQVKYENNEKVVEKGVEEYDRIISGMSSQEFVNIYSRGAAIEDSFLCRHHSRWESMNLIVLPSASVASAMDKKELIFTTRQFYGSSPLYMGDPNILDTPTIKGVPHDSLPQRQTQFFLSYPFHKKYCSNNGQSCDGKLEDDQIAQYIQERFEKTIEFKSLNARRTIDNYFPHSKDLQECDPWEILELQGQNNLYFIGGTVNFESVEHVIRYNQYIVDTHLNS